MKLLIAVLGVLASPALAQEPPATSDGADTGAVNWEESRARAADLRNRVKQMRFQADRTRDDAAARCRERILVASCMEDARKARLDAEGAIRRLEQEARQIELQLRAHEHEVKLERRAEKHREQESEAARRAEEIRRKDEKRLLKQEKQRAEEERRRRKAAAD